MSNRTRALFAIFVMVWIGTCVKAQYTASQEHPLIHDMVDQLRRQLRVAQACTARASHNELADFCAKQVSDRMAKIDRLLSWSKQWNSTDIIEHRDILKDPAVKKLLSSKKPRFDSEYLNFIRSLNIRARSLSARCSETAAREELRQFCSQVESRSTTEDQEAEKLLSEWSGADGSAQPGRVK